MSVKLDWEVGDDQRGQPDVQRGWPVSSTAALLMLAIATLVLLAALLFARSRAVQAEAQLRERIQSALEAEQRAYFAGDGTSFYLNQVSNPAWISAQLQPENQMFYDYELTVTRVTRDEDELWANVSWTEEEITWQRLIFFRLRGEDLIHVSGSDTFWGSVVRVPAYWGAVHLHEADREWAEEIASFVSNLVARTCGSTADNLCISDRRQFVLDIADDYAATAEKGHVQVPSPRLVALDEEGEPADLFWERLRRELIAYLTPARIRFAVPYDPTYRNELVDYEELAAEFSAARAGIEVEIVGLAEELVDELDWIDEVDGAAVTPSERMVKAGLLFDLTDYVESDPDFDEGDFYEQIWQGAWWNDRIWFMPQAGVMPVMYYDKNAYGNAELDEPPLLWSWEEMVGDIERLSAVEPVDTGIALNTVFFDIGRDILFSYAYGRDPGCAGLDGSYCARQLRPEAISDALGWYKQMTGREDLMPNLSDMSDEERQLAFYNIKAALWVDSPLQYEHHLLLRPIGVTTLPGSDRSEAVSPIWLTGSFISAYSENRLATWEWLKFLSYQSLSREYRRVPARPSVATSTSFWSTLPGALNEALRAAFPHGQPVRIADQEYFDWPLLAQVLSGQISPGEAGRIRITSRWFLPTS